MDLFQPYIQLRFMSNAPIRTKIITNTYIRETTLVQYELLSQTVLKHPIQASSGIHFVTSKIIMKFYYMLYTTNGTILV